MLVCCIVVNLYSIYGMKHRITELRGVYKIEKKHWLFGWTPLTELYVGIDGDSGYGDKLFSSVEEAEAYLNPPQPEVVKYL